MDDRAPEQSMEDILASIKRVISADVDAARRLPPAPVAIAPVEEAEDVLELGAAPDDAGDTLLSGATAEASKAALAALVGLSIDPKADANTLDGLVREMLRPMLKQWLDANLPDIVERVVTREVARVVGR
jgi:cell pole-organizing protein PopZ